MNRVGRFAIEFWSSGPLEEGGGEPIFYAHVEGEKRGIACQGVSSFPNELHWVEDGYGLPSGSLPDYAPTVEAALRRFLRAQTPSRNRQGESST